jgi:hypothetical protein
MARLLEHRRRLCGAVARHCLDFLGSRQDLSVCRFIKLVVDHCFRSCKRKTSRPFTMSVNQRLRETKRHFNQF